MIDRIFLSHPRSVGETYGTHFSFAIRFGGNCLLAGLACCIHAIIPALFKTTASTIVKSMHNRITTR